MMIKFVLLLLAIAAALGSYTVDPHFNVLRDEHNRIRIFHGINSVYKQFPYHPVRDSFNSNGSLVKQDFQNLKKWGFNSVRLYIAWQGFQPKRHQYNYTYLSVLKQIVRQAETYGINIIIDAHHDLYSKKFCGQGFPTWLGQVSSFPAPFKVKFRYDEDGLPLKQDCMKRQFISYYTTFDVVSFSQDFYKNKYGMLDMFIQMWVKVVTYFKDQQNVIGYDILNEPAGGNLWWNPFSYIGPSQENNHLLLPFYKKISAQIRKVEKDKLLYFQVAPQDLIGSFYEPISNSSKDVFNFHTYCPFHKKLGAKKCDIFNYFYVRNRQKEAHKLGYAGVCTQFGSVPDTAQGRREIASVIKNLDKYLMSWYYWQFKYNMDSTCSTNPPWLHAFYYPNSTLQLEKVKTLSYSYAYAICGKFVKQTTERGSYSLTYFPSNCRGKYTQIFLSLEFDFPNGYVIKFTPECPTCKLRMIDLGYYEVIPDDDLLGKPFSVDIGAKISSKSQ